MKIMRNMLQEYYGITTTSGQTSTTTYYHMNKGVIKLTENGGVTTESTAYVGDKNATVEVTGYENNWEYEAQYVSDDPVSVDLRKIAINQKTGSDCERKLISVDLNKPGTTEGTYLARQFDVVVEANPPQGDPRSVVTMSGKIHQCGDFVTGTFTLSSKTFVADETNQDV